MSEGILYSAVAKSDIILVSSQESFGDFEDQAKSFLDQIPDGGTKACFPSHTCNFHILVDDGLIYICAAKANFGRTVPYAFLNEIKERFNSGSLAVRSWNASEHEFDRDFGNVLKEEMATFGRQQGVGTIGKVQGQVEDVIDIMNDNIHKVVERGEKLDDLIDKTNDLEITSKQFHTTSKKIRRKFWCKNVKMWMILIILLIIIITVIILVATNVIPLKKQ